MPWHPGPMQWLSSPIATWNTFAPTLPITVDPALLWIALPLAVIAVLFLAVFACGRRRLTVATATVQPVSSAAATPANPAVRPRRHLGARAHGPRGPTLIGAVAQS